MNQKTVGWKVERKIILSCDKIKKAKNVMKYKKRYISINEYWITILHTYNPFYHRVQYLQL